jgi:RNA polymerase sigma factor (TIGR02999 family)
MGANILNNLGLLPGHLAGMSRMSEQLTVVEALTRIESGDSAAADTLFELVYQDLRRRAAYYLAQHRGGGTLQPTAIVHEAYLKLAGATNQWKSKRHFFNAAAEAMRQIIVSHARTKAAQKRGGQAKRVDLDEADLAASSGQTDWEALDVALNELKREDERRYQVVMHRFFAGLEHAQIAEMLEVSERTVERDWKLAKMYLLGKLSTREESF